MSPQAQVAKSTWTAFQLGEAVQSGFPDPLGLAQRWAATLSQDQNDQKEIGRWFALSSRLETSTKEELWAHCRLTQGSHCLSIACGPMYISSHLSCTFIGGRGAGATICF